MLITLVSTTVLVAGGMLAIMLTVASAALTAAPPVGSTPTIPTEGVVTGRPNGNIPQVAQGTALTTPTEEVVTGKLNGDIPQVAQGPAQPCDNRVVHLVLNQDNDPQFVTMVVSVWSLSEWGIFWFLMLAYAILLLFYTPNMGLKIVYVFVMFAIPLAILTTDEGQRVFALVIDRVLVLDRDHGGVGNPGRLWISLLMAITAVVCFGFFLGHLIHLIVKKLRSKVKTNKPPPYKTMPEDQPPAYDNGVDQRRSTEGDGPVIVQSYYDLFP